ncbi:MAG TPA: tRNA lysidine(34) synthetase TilS [Oscillospiraceae bacterium]|nr:tRNA lysidine(34) synthetase TilS [Oscillospiraceae bacterium]HNW04904.1 tRNA lysidine(34) synthetase TilS [Oscillospiraceae bacterium]
MELQDGARFPKLTLDKVKETVSKYEMLQPGEKVLLGVSGGCDSSVLLHLMSFLSTQWGLTLEAAHVNHNLRGPESLRDERFVRSMCREYGIKLHVMNADVRAYAEEHRLCEEEAGRELRYQFFEHCAKRMGKGTKIATAHTLSDCAETFLFNMARGTGLSGLCGIPPVRGDIIRPLIETTRNQIEAFCAEQGIPYITDSSNLADNYARNRIRHSAVPVLMEINPSFERAFLRMTDQLRQDRDFLDDLSDELLDTAEIPTGFDGETLALAEPALKTRAAAKMLRRFGFPCEYEHIVWIAEHFGKEDFKLELAKDAYFVQKGGLVCREDKRPAEAITPSPFSEGIAELLSGKFAECHILDAFCFKNSHEFHQYVLKNAFDYDKIHGVAVIRSRREGDQINLTGCTKTLKKLFNETKVPVHLRKTVAVIADDDGVLWVEGFGADRRAKITEETGTVAVIKTSRR